MDEGFFYCPYIPESFKRAALEFEDHPIMKSKYYTMTPRPISLQEMESSVWGPADKTLISDIEQEWATRILEDSVELEAAIHRAVKSAAEEVGLQKFAYSLTSRGQRKVLSSR